MMSTAWPRNVCVKGVTCDGSLEVGNIDTKLLDLLAVGVYQAMGLVCVDWIE